MTEYQQEKYIMMAIWFVAIILIFVLISGVMWALPKYSVYKRNLYGQAELAEAEWSKRVLVETAKAQNDSAELYAEAEIKRAKGAAKANEILAGSLGGPEGYLRWLYINMMEKTKNNLIYIPTEAGLPILEAGRANK